MGRTRVSATVGTDLLTNARHLCAAGTDTALIDEALEALLAKHRSSSGHRRDQIDPRYGAYDQHPAEEPDAWGDLASFRRAASAS